MKKQDDQQKKIGDWSIFKGEVFWIYCIRRLGDLSFQRIPATKKDTIDHKSFIRHYISLVAMARRSKNKIEKPPHRRAWRRDENGRLVSYNLQGRPNVGDGKDLEVFWHVEHEKFSEVLPPPQTLWQQQKGIENQIKYVPVWVEIEQRLAVPQRRSSLTDSLPNGVPYLYSYYAKTKELDRRWRPYDIVANGGFGVIITYISDSFPLDENLDVPDDQLRVAKFNYKGGDLVDILRPVVTDFSLRAWSRRANTLGTSMGRWEHLHHGHRGHHFHRKTVTDGRGRKKNRPTPQGMFSQENTILELLSLTGTPHVPALWKVVAPPQDGTLLTLEYIPGGKTLDEHLNFYDNHKVHIKRIWEATLCITKAMSAMAYGSEDPAPSHRVYGWNEIVHVDWTPPNIFVVEDYHGHTCTHNVCYKVGDFGFAMILPYKPASRTRFRNGELKRPWYTNLCPQELPVSFTPHLCQFHIRL